MAQEDIVLVDDDRVIQKMVGGFLERTGYRVRKASNGIEALELVHTRVPDLIITDVRMPELNGIELTSRLRSDASVRTKLRQAEAQVAAGKLAPTLAVEEIARLLGV